MSPETDPYTIVLPHLKLQEHLKSTPAEVAETWISQFNQHLASKSNGLLSALFYEDSWWRDMLALSWDIRTLHPLPKISSYLEDHLPKSGFRNCEIRQDGAFAPSLQHPTETLDWIQFMFDFETNVGHGTGVLRLVQVDDGGWKAFAISTSLQNLKGSVEKVGLQREVGDGKSLRAGGKEGNWAEQRGRQAEFLDADPCVLIIGAGQAGLNTAARLQQLGLTALIIDRNPRIGDNWRCRYKTLITHDPVHYNHMAYLPFPSAWPLFTAKDKLGDWFEAYASILELNVWTNTTITSSTYSTTTNTWSINLHRSDTKTTRVLSPRHIILCTGQSGAPKIPTFPGQDVFQGKVYHASEHQDASLLSEVTDKRVLVVGTGNSGHDIAQNFYENGAAQVTMLQRKGTYVITSEKGLFMLHTGMYEEGGPKIEDVDLVGQSLPIPVQFALNVGLTARIAEVERETLEGLERAGFKLDAGEDGSGIYRKYVQRGGGYYIDVGCSELIIEGKVKIVQSEGGIKRFYDGGVVLADRSGTEVEADVVVLATGFENMRSSVKAILGESVAERCKDVWDLDGEGEINAMWRDSGHPGFWYMGGSLALSRIYSKVVALQIKAIEAGLS